MEKPDNDGYVNIKWPSKSVPYGGIFHTRPVNDSSNNQEFLKVLLQESKFDIELRQKDAFGFRKAREENKSASDIRAPVNVVRPHTSRRRSLSAIRLSGALEMDDYHPLKRGEDREKLKEKLAHIMQYGDSPDQPPPPPKVPTTKTAQKKIPTSKDRWHDLVTQIRERAEWLAEMEYLGQADAHRDIIREQIAERMRALDALGIEDTSDTPRSTASGFSTTRSRENVPMKSAHRSAQHSNRSSSTTKSQKLKKQEGRSSQRSAVIEENIRAYNKLSPLQYSPRRRV